MQRQTITYNGIGELEQEILQRFNWGVNNFREFKKENLIELQDLFKELINYENGE